MTQLTIRGIDQELEDEIRSLAEAKGISLSRAALELIRRGTGFTREPGVPARAIGSALDCFIGTWTAEEAAEFDRSIAALGTIDPELWQ